VAQTHSIALRDADFHNGIAGVTIVEAAGSFGPSWVPAGVGAASGVHRLIVKSDCNARLHQLRLAGVSLHDQLRTALMGRLPSAQGLIVRQKHMK
jgi:hypothetical protein